jgi:hypothetical protein
MYKLGSGGLNINERIEITGTLSPFFISSFMFLSFCVGGFGI